ncbi:MAG: hypothetical protein M3O31_06715 [Acidobacteriota bacterium]|nr:hypothetical protein [Acidobacteriota bacterium]
MNSTRPISNAFAALLIVTVLGASYPSSAQESTGAMFAASDGKGHVSLLWFPPPSRWPSGGWRLSDSAGQVLVPQISLGDPAAVQSLSVEDADVVRKLPAVLARPDPSPKRKQLINILGMRAFSELGFARSLGLAWTLESVPPGSHSYKIEGLGADGKPSGLQLTATQVDSSRPTPLPPSPADLQAKVDTQGVALLFTSPAENRQLPTIAYTVERDGGGQNGAAVTAKPIILGARWDPKIPVVVDRNAPPNEMLTYRVFSIDVFGRRSEPSIIRIFYPDFRALMPPQPVIAEGGLGKIVVRWKAEQKANLAGYLVERGFLQAGPYESLTAQALPPGTAQYEDGSARGGTTYYYRVRAVNLRGDLGTPSDAAAAQSRNRASPPKVEGLAADAGQTRVRLTWKPVPFPVAGYFVERQAVSGIAGVESWVRLNPHVTPEPLLDDYLGLSSGATMKYRVVAVAFDNSEGPPGDPVQVVLADRSLPTTPLISGVSGIDGKVTLTFQPGSPAAKATQFLVLRSGRADDLGVVIGDPLPGNSRQFVDLYVAPGESYWYRIVVTDEAGNRSDPTRPVAVRVSASAIPTPATPALRYSATPYPHVVIEFAAPPAGLLVIVERQEQSGGGWIRIAGPLTGMTAADNSLPKGKSTAYRISYLTSDGSVGPTSEVVDMTNH